MALYLYSIFESTTYFSWNKWTRIFLPGNEIICNLLDCLDWLCIWSNSVLFMENRISKLSWNSTWGCLHSFHTNAFKKSLCPFLILPAMSQIMVQTQLSSLGRQPVKEKITKTVSGNPISLILATLVTTLILSCIKSWLFDDISGLNWSIDSNGKSTFHGLFYAKRLGNCFHYMFILTFFYQVVS